MLQHLLLFLTISLFGGLPVESWTLDGRFNVSVDHFRPQDIRQQNFLYRLNIDNYREGGPLFFFINDAGTYTERWIESGLMYDIATNLGGALFTLDLRYFGANHPTEDTSLENLQYLTIQQILADIAQLIVTVRKQLLNSNSKIFIWGSGYGGTLAIFARQQFPHLINAAWSSDGIFQPILFTTDKFDRLAENIGNVGGDYCGQRFAVAFNQIENLIQNGDLNNTLNNEFSICPSFNVSNGMDQGVFLESIIDKINGFISREHATGIDILCRSLAVIPEDPLRAFGRWYRFEFSGDLGQCNHFSYSIQHEFLTNQELQSAGVILGIRQNAYLKCTEFGHFQTTHPQSVWGHRITEQYHRQICSDLLSDDNFEFDLLQINLNWLKTMHGNQNPMVSKVIFTNNMLNPLIELGLTEFEEDIIDRSVINIPFHGKGADLSSINNRDSIYLNDAKQKIVTTILNWMAQ